MISRQWCGIAKRSDADRYIEHLRADTFPQLARIPGFVAAAILRRSMPQGVEFRIVTTWQTLDAVRQFAGANCESAVVPENVQAMMVSYDATVAHYEVVE